MNCIGVQAMESILLISFWLINIYFVERIFTNKKQYALARFQTTSGQNLSTMVQRRRPFLFHGFIFFVASLCLFVEIENDGVGKRLDQRDCAWDADAAGQNIGNAERGGEM